MEELFYWIWLSILNLRTIEKIKILEIFKEPKNIYDLDKTDLRKFTNSERLINIIIDGEKRKEANKILQDAQKQKIKLICFKNKYYSKELLKIYDYPILLYAKGNLELLNTEAISIVGCRDCSEYGKNIAQKFSYMLSQNNYTIVSGMAKGIDSAAHQGSLLNNGKTIAVLGSGVNYIYPYENKNLYFNILNNGGLIISEYGINTKPCPEYFPKRNRIVSGLSKKILVIEAGIKSGSIITAELAIEQGKDVYAVPRKYYE